MDPGEEVLPWECCQGHGPWAAITGEGLGGTGDISSDVGTGQEVWPGGRKPVRLRRRVCAEEAGKEFEKQMVKDCQEGFWSRGVTWWKSCLKQLNFSKKGKTKTQRGVKKDITKLSDKETINVYALLGLNKSNCGGKKRIVLSSVWIHEEKY